MTEWWEQRQGRAPAGLAFECTMCGACCTGGGGFVLVDDDEIAALARRLGLTPEEFRFRHTHATPRGLSLNERLSRHGLDCEFLDRETIPGKAICGVYEDRPRQCRTWPFWKSNLASQDAWRRARAVCPGIGRGRRVSVRQVRILRDAIDI